MNLRLLQSAPVNDTLQSVVDGQPNLGHGWSMLAEVFREEGLKPVMNLDVKRFQVNFQTKIFLIVNILIQIKKEEAKTINRNLVRDNPEEAALKLFRQAYLEEYGFEPENADLGQNQRAVIVMADGQLFLIKDILRKLDLFMKRRSAELQAGLGKGPFLLELMRKQITDLYDLLSYFEKLLEKTKFLSRQAFKEIEIDLTEVDERLFRFGNLLQAINLAIAASLKSPANLISEKAIRRICLDMEIAPYTPAELERVKEEGKVHHSLRDLDKFIRTTKLELLDAKWHDFLNRSSLDNYGFLLASKWNDALQDNDLEQAEWITVMTALYQNDGDVAYYTKKRTHFKQCQSVELELRETKKRTMSLLPAAGPSTSETSTTEASATAKP